MVDDEPTIVEFVRINLEKAGFRVLTAGDGETALRLAASEPVSYTHLDVYKRQGYTGGGLGQRGGNLCRLERRLW